MNVQSVGENPLEIHHSNEGSIIVESVVDDGAVSELKGNTELGKKSPTLFHCRSQDSLESDGVPGFRTSSSLKDRRHTAVLNRSDFRNGPPLGMLQALRGSMKGPQGVLVAAIGSSDKRRHRVRRMGLYFLAYCDMVLRGFSQVYLADNPVSGLLLLAALCLSRDPLRGGYALLGCTCSTLGAAFTYGGLFPGGADMTDLLDGLYGYDGVLVGAAFNLFFGSTTTWVLVVSTAVAAFATGMLRKASQNYLSAMQLPAFTIAFNVMTLAMLLCVRAGSIELTESKSLHPTTMYRTTSLRRPDVWLEGIVVGVGQLTFVDTPTGSAFVMAALCWCDLAIALQCITGSFLSGCFRLAFGGFGGRLAGLTNGEFRFGLYGYNGAATAVVAYGGSVMHAERRQLKDLFDEVDVDGSNTIERDELCGFLQSLVRASEGSVQGSEVGQAEQQHGSHRITDEEASALFDAIRKADPERMTFPEFAAWWTERSHDASNSLLSVVQFSEVSRLWKIGLVILASLLCAFCGAALEGLLNGYPVLTLPFVLSSWALVLVKRQPKAEMLETSRYTGTLDGSRQILTPNDGPMHEMLTPRRQQARLDLAE